MSELITKALNAGFWYSVMRFASQVLSWFFTIYTARLLAPADFGLMAMAAFFTAQLERFSELGFGVAIVQRSKVNSQELSSAFWFVVALGGLFTCCTFLLVSPTVWVFQEPKIKYVTMLIAPLFLIGAVGVVPLSIMKRGFRFREIGTIDFIAMLASSIVTVIMAKEGAGVYALIVGLIVMRSSKSILIFYLSNWRPQFFFSFASVKPFLKFGLQVIMSGVFLRMLESLDKLIIGRFFSAQFLGVYGYAMTLAALPTGKIWPIFNEILLSTLAKIQGNTEEFKKVVLVTLKFFLYIITPILLGGSAFAEEIIVGILGQKWQAAVPFFRVFCVSQLFFLVGIYFTVVNNSKGKPQRNLKYNLLSAILVLASVFFCALKGEEYILLPWITVLPLLVCGWVFVNIRLHGIEFREYMGVLVRGIVPGIGVVLLLLVIRNLAINWWLDINLIALVSGEVFLGALLYLAYFATFNRRDAEMLIKLIRKKGDAGG